MVEQGTENPRVSGSIPLEATIKDSSAYKDVGIVIFFTNFGGIEKDVPNYVRQKQFGELFLGRGLPIPLEATIKDSSAYKDVGIVIFLLILVESIWTPLIKLVLLGFFYFV